MTEVDLASRALGGSVVAASDESFGFKERLIDPGEPAFVPGTYDLRGEVVDGWETRRHADGDWAIVRLGVGGRLRTIDVDTRFFAGNHPTGCRVDACVLDPVADPTAAARAVDDDRGDRCAETRLPQRFCRRRSAPLHPRAPAAALRWRRRAIAGLRRGHPGSCAVVRRHRRSLGRRAGRSCRMVF